MNTDFYKATLEYNEGFVDGILWVLSTGGKASFNEIEKMVLDMAVDIKKANAEKLNDEEKQFNI